MLEERKDGSIVNEEFEGKCKVKEDLLTGFRGLRLSRDRRV